MSDALRFGILGTGTIANLFATGLADAEGCRLHAVGSRTEQAARKFAQTFDIDRAHSNYQALVDDPEVDAIYIATPNTLHRENAVSALRAGKHVLCEKPFTINASETRHVMGVAMSGGLFVMEAMWTRFFPIMVKLRELLADGAIGTVQSVSADFGFAGDYEEDAGLFDPTLGGGALLDVGIYPLSFASMILGTPNRIESLALMAPTGVDESAGIMLGYEGGQTALCQCSIRHDSPQEATVVGSTGYIRIHAPFWRPEALSVVRHGVVEARIELPYVSNGYGYEAEEVARCVAAGKSQSDVMPLSETLRLMETMDLLRAQWGLRYPGE